MKVAVLSSHTPSLFWFRMDMMKGFIKNGHSVIAIGPESEEQWREKFIEHNIEYKQIFADRTGINPITDLKTFANLVRFMRKEKPDRLFAYQAKTIVYGSIAAKFNGITEVYSLIAGLGSIFRGRGFKNTIIKKVMMIEYWLACKCNKKVFFQNNDDKNQFILNGLIGEDKAVIINGSGVNLEIFDPRPLPKEPAFLFIGRLIKDKGVVEYLEACAEIKAKYPNVRCLLVGPYDSNPSALKAEELKPYIDKQIIEYFGEQTDVRTFIAQCSTYVLPSYHEGTPKTVLEAMAMGRPIITSNAPGCKDAVTDGINGFLVEVKDVKGIVEKMEYLVENPSVWRDMGDMSLKIVKEKYDVKDVNQDIMRTMKLLDEGELLCPCMKK